MYASAVNVAAVLGFALSMPFGFDFGSFFCSMFIAFSFVPMMCAYAFYADQESKLAGLTAVGFSSIYTAIIILVYFAQLTTVRLEQLTDQAFRLLSFGQFGLLFNYDLLGYAVMALATFFAGLTVKAESRESKWLRRLLLIHGVFFISCLLFPMTGMFTAGGSPWIGVAVLEVWCVYFVPVGVLGYRYFAKRWVFSMAKKRSPLSFVYDIRIEYWPSHVFSSASE